MSTVFSEMFLFNPRPKIPPAIPPITIKINTTGSKAGILFVTTEESRLAICGIGGGVIIKPVLDAFQMMDVSTISFLSGCTVLSMTTYSVIKSKMSKTNSINSKTALPLALGAAVGGILGKWLFSLLTDCFPISKVGAVQSICLMLITIGTLVYTIYKAKIKTYHVTSPVFSCIIGVVLGLLSSFLGIGGGPINLVILFFFFSMSTKEAAENSLYIIFFSQIASLLSSVVTSSIPAFDPVVLIFMVIGGIAGGIFGRGLNKKISEKTVDKLFIGLMVVIIFINIYNFYCFM